MENETLEMQEDVSQEYLAEIMDQESAGSSTEVQVPEVPTTIEGVPTEQVVEETLEQKLLRLEAEIAQLKTVQEPTKTEMSDADAFIMLPKPGPMLVSAGGKPPKNHVEGKAGSGKYVLLSKNLATWGKVPSQQAAIADILSKNFEPRVEIQEVELVAALVRDKGKYPSLNNSVQSVTYLFRYYRGLKHSGNHAGFIARNFLQKVA